MSQSVHHLKDELTRYLWAFVNYLNDNELEIVVDDLNVALVGEIGETMQKI